MERLRLKHDSQNIENAEFLMICMYKAYSQSDPSIASMQSFKYAIIH